MADEVEEIPEREPDPRFYQLRSAAYNDPDEAARLIEADPSIIDARNSLGETAFHWLVVEDEREAVRFLLEHGSDINTRHDFGETPLMEAAGLGYTEMCRFLLERGADAKARTKNGDTALAKAAQGKNAETVELLLSLLEPDEDINTYFSEWAAHRVLTKRKQFAEQLQRRGLKDRG